MRAPKHIGIVGRRFHRWLVLRITPNKYRGTEYMAECRCDCGTVRITRIAGIITGDSKSCGCLRQEMVDGRRFVGKTYGMLTVLERTDQQDGRQRWLYRCACACGKEVLLIAAELGWGQKSCGCLRGVRLPRGQAGFNRLVEEYRRGAKDRGFDLLLTTEEIMALSQADCFYCGVKPSTQKKTRQQRTDHSTFIYNGIDRVDNSKGYVLENCVTCCKVCNMAKNAMDQTAFIEMARAIAARHP